MVLNVTFNNISFISWRSVLFMEVAGIPGENHRPVASHSKKGSYELFPCLSVRTVYIIQRVCVCVCVKAAVDTCIHSYKTYYMISILVVKLSN
jgi:hypothetical protein